MGHRAFRGIVSVAVLSAAVMLAGCQSNPKPPPLDAASAAASPTPSESNEAAPTLPAEAKGTSEASAKAFVRHWVEVLNYAGPAGDGDALRGVSDVDCAACGAIADFITETTSAGGEIQGTGWSIRRLKIISFQTGRRAVIDAETLVTEQRVRPSSDSAFRTFPGGSHLKTFWLTHEGGAWSVERLDQPE